MALSERKNKLLDSSCRKWLWAIYSAIIAGKALMASKLYILANGNAYHDEMLGVSLAQSLINGDWLGKYNARTLVKGITFPVFLALNSFAGIPYTVSVTVLYGLACVLMCRALRPVLKKDFFIFLTFLVLFFNPANGNSSSFLRVYRNSLSPVLLLLLIASFIELYYSKGRRIWLRAVWAGVCLALFVNNREDSFWIYPFVFSAAAISAVKFYAENRNNGEKKRTALLAFIIPFLIVFLVNSGIKAENKKYYGVPYRNELSEGGFPELMKAIYSIEPEEDLYRVSVPQSTVNLVCDFCPTFSELKPLLEENYGDGWDTYDGVTDGQICDGWFFWCLRECIYDTFYDLTPAEISEKCSQMAQEIISAMNEGNLRARSGIVMPSALMSPYKMGYAKDLCVKFRELIKSAAGFRQSDEFAYYRIGDPDTLKSVEELTASILDPAEGKYEGIRRYVYSFYKKVNRVYMKFGKEMLVLALMSWCASAALLLNKKCRSSATIDGVLFSFGFIASAMVFLLGAAYTDISAFDTDSVLYLSTVYPLLSAFCCVSIFSMISILAKRKRGES